VAQLGYIRDMPPLPLTSTLNLALAGDAAAAERAWTEVYGEVRAIAAAAIAREGAGGAADADLHPTGLVHEIFLRIGRNPPRAWDSRRHFFGAVAQACEQALIDLARTRKALKRGSGKAPVPLTFVAGELANTDNARAAAEFGLPAALDALARDYPRAAEVARLRYVLGMPNLEVAKVLGVSDSTVEKDWTFARAWLRRALDRAE
jgi:RNA polymerase sigma factor (TIGR02999 family)